MRTFFKSTLFLLSPVLTQAQTINIDSFKNVFRNAPHGPQRFKAASDVYFYYQEINRMTALTHYEEMLKLAKKTKQKVWEAEALSRNGYVSCLIQNYSGALNFLLLAKDLASQKGLENDMWNPSLLSKKNSSYEARLTILCDITHHLGLVHFFFR